MRVFFANRFLNVRFQLKLFLVRYERNLLDLLNLVQYDFNFITFLQLRNMDFESPAGLKASCYALGCMACNLAIMLKIYGTARRNSEFSSKTFWQRKYVFLQYTHKQVYIASIVFLQGSQLG